MTGYENEKDNRTWGQKIKWTLFGSGKIGQELFKIFLEVKNCH